MTSPTLRGRSPRKVFSLSITISTFLLTLSIGLNAQERRYFTPHYQKVTTEKTEYQRAYAFESGIAKIEDRKSGMIEHTAVISGLTDLAQIDDFATYVYNHGPEFYYRPYFKGVKGTFEFYQDENISRKVIVRGDQFRYAQVWDSNGAELLENGNGSLSFQDAYDNETITETFVDSLQVTRLGVRPEKKDTIYYTFDKAALPKDGLPSFYQYLVKNLKYPGLARLAGKEGRIYVQFVVDKNGNLTDFRPLTTEGHNFEEKAIKKLEAAPRWEPAVYHGRKVKAKYVLPINFSLTK